MDPSQIVVLVNGIGLILFTVLVGAILGLLVRRAQFYALARKTIPVILRRDLILFGALSIVGVETLLVRAAGVVFESWTRLAFVLHWDIILIGALIYWISVELNDIDDPEVK
jgi:hypothetical protein